MLIAIILAAPICSCVCCFFPCSNEWTNEWTVNELPDRIAAYFLQIAVREYDCSGESTCMYPSVGSVFDKTLVIYTGMASLLSPMRRLSRACGAFFDD